MNGSPARSELHLVQGATHDDTCPDGRRHLQEAVGAIGDFLANRVGSG